MYRREQYRMRNRGQHKNSSHKQVFSIVRQRRFVRPVIMA